MAYTKQTWADLPSKTTPINAERLTHIEDGIFSAAQTADTAASTAGTAAANVGIVSGRVETLTERVNGLDTAVGNKVDKVAGKGLSTNDYDNTDKGKVDSLGTASTKNSTSVVTDSSDLVESGAVYDALGFGNKNLFDPKNIRTNSTTEYVPIYVGDGEFTLSTNAPKNTSNNANIFLMSGNQQSGSTTSANGVWSDNPRTFASENGYVTVATRSVDGVNPQDYNIQLEKGSTATAYESYHASVEETIPQVVSDAVGWDVGNLFKVTASSGSARTINFTVDNNIITADGTATGGNASFTINNNVALPKGNYKTSGGINNNKMFVLTAWNGSTYVKNLIQLGSMTEDLIVDYNGYDTIQASIFVREGTQCNNDVFTPLIYHYTVDEQKADNSVIGTVEGANASKAWSVGEHFIKDGQFKEVTQAIANGGAINDSNTVNKPIADCLIKQEAFTITTNADGLANLTNQGSRIVLRIDSANSKICFPYKTTGGTNNIIVFNNDMTVAGNTEVRGTYYYI